MIFTDTQAIDELKALIQEGTPDWVHTARDNSKVYRALVEGDNFADELIKIEGIESQAKADVRRKYSKDIRDVFERVMKPRENVFQSNGGSEKITIKNETTRNDFIFAQSNFKSNKSVTKYLSEVYFTLLDIDPNGLLFLEYKSGTSLPYPTYKSIDDIYFYEPNGQKVEYVVFEPKTIISNGVTIKLYRFVDDVSDRVISVVGELYSIYKSFNHPFGETPGLIISEKEKLGTNLRLSAIEKIIEIAKDLARDKSILTIYKFQKGHPIHWRFVTQCRSCQGTGKTSGGRNVGKGNNNKANYEKETCQTCDGHGYKKNQDVTDIVTIPIPDIDQPNIAPHIAGFESPDLETWKQYKIDIKDYEFIMKDTIWGTFLYSSHKQNQQETETATGRYIDVQPIVNQLNVFSDGVEYVDNTLCHWILNFVDKIKNKKEVQYSRTYGRRFIIETPDVILTKYQESKDTSDSSTVLDKQLEEYILSKYKNDPIMQNIMLKKKDIEPYVHLTFDQVNSAFGPEEAYKKELFNTFWNQCDIYKSKIELKSEMETYFTSNKKVFKPAEPKIPTAKKPVIKKKVKK